MDNSTDWAIVKEEVTQASVDATGCLGAGDYATWAKAQGYNYIEVLDWTSSAGDWSFLVSKDGHEWVIMWQENNYPRSAGFTRQLDFDHVFFGTPQEAIESVYALWGY